MILPSVWSDRRTGAAAGWALCGLIPVLLATPAQAQLFNQFLPEEIYGRDVEPDVTVASRVRTGYDNGGIHAGNFIIRPQLTESVGYETNVLATERNQRGSFLAQTDGSVEARNETSRGVIIAGANVTDFRYASLQSNSYTNYSVRLGGVYSLGRDSATLFVSHALENQTPLDLGVPQLSAPLAVSNDRAQASYRTSFGRVTLTPSVEVGRLAYNSGVVNGIVYDQSFRNRIVVTPSVTAAYELAPRRNLVVVVRDTAASYSRSTPENPIRDYNDVELLGGIDYDVNGIFRARVLAGYERRTFSSNAYATIQAPVAELTLIYNPTGLTTVTGIFARRIQDSANEATAASTSLSATVKVDHEFRRNVILSASGVITQNEYGSSSGSQIFYEGTLSGSYLFNRYLSASAKYDLLARTSSNSNVLNLNGLSTGSNYIDHRMLLQLRVAL